MIEIQYDNQYCKICNRFLTNRRSLGNHLVRAHSGYDIEKYLLQFFLNNQKPKCDCGCGGEVQWHKTKLKYNEYIAGHNNRFSSENQPDISSRIKNHEKIKIEKPKAEKTKQPKLIKTIKETKKNTTEKHSFVSLDLSILESTSKSSFEINFFNNLKEIFPGVIEGFEIQNQIFDYYIPAQNCLIEFDDELLHGYDRIENFDTVQLINIANDFRKTTIALENNINLLRFKGNINNFNSFDELKDKAFHIQNQNQIEKYGMFKFRNEDQKLMSREQLIRINEKEIFSDALGREHTEKYILNALISFLRDYCNLNGWIYPNKDQSCLNAILSIRKANIDITENTLSSTRAEGTNYLRSIFKSYWNVNDGPYESFQSNKKLEQVLRYRLGLNNSKSYKYELSDGSSVSCKETFDINIKNIRRGFIVQRKAVSFFKPTAAFHIYKKIIGGKEEVSVYDPSCGFGARMLGFFAAYPKGNYYGTEPANETYSDLLKLKEELKNDLILVEEQFKLFKCGSEVVRFEPERKFDLVFTSPPYFDLEKYFDEPGQCWKDFPTKDSWYKNYLIPTFKNCINHLKDDGKIVINIDKAHEDLILLAAKELDLNLKETLNLSIGRDHFSKKNGIREENFEPIFVFEKV
jgi:hypothetical protein